MENKGMFDNRINHLQNSAKIMIKKNLPSTTGTLTPRARTALTSSYARAYIYFIFFEFKLPY